MWVLPYDKEMKKIADFLFEVGILNKTPRSGFHFLGSGDYSVAEHILRTIYVGYALSKIAGQKVDENKVVRMCLFHDLAEARVSDLNYVHQKYTQRREELAIADLAASLPFGADIEKTVNEYLARKSREALLAKDADIIEWIICLKEQLDIGNSRARDWIPSAVKRLKTAEGKKLTAQIMKTDSDNWWFANKSDPWWVSRNQKK